jgi:hypothetical protein
LKPQDTSNEFEKNIYYERNGKKMKTSSITGVCFSSQSFRWLTVILMCFFFLGNPFLLKAENEFHASNEFSYTYNDISGPGSSQSSLRQGFSYLNLLNINDLGNYKGFDYNFNFGLKLTDDPTNDQQTASITNLQGRITNKVHTLNLGDTFETFSQYALSSAVKGASYRFVKENSYIPEVSLVYGYAYSRWDNAFAIYDGPVKAVARQVMGARLKENLGQNFWAGLSYVQSQDNDRVNPTDSLYLNRAYTFDMEYKPIPGLTVSGEASLSDQKEWTGNDGSETTRHGAAYRLTAVGDADPSRVTLEYERISPNFTTLVGSATPDREKAKAKWRYKYTKNISANLGFLWFRDNLDGQKTAGRTDYYKPEIGFTLKRFLGRAYGTADIAYKLDVTSNNNTENYNHIVTLNYQDQFFGFLDSDTNLGYTLYDNKISVEERNNEFTYNTSLSSRHTLGMVVLKPAVYLGGWTQRSELVVSTDQIYEYSAGFGLDVPDWKLTSTIKAGQNRLDKSVGQDTDKTFASFNLNYRPPFLKKLNQGMLFFRAKYNDFSYTNAGNNFRETSLTAGLILEI